MTDRIASLRSHPHPLESLDWRLSHRNAAAPISPTDLWLSKQGQLHPPPPPTTTTTKKSTNRSSPSNFTFFFVYSFHFFRCGKVVTALPPPSSPSSPGDWAFNSWVARADLLWVFRVCVSTQLGPWAKRVSEGGRETKVTKMGEREEKGEKTSRRGQIHCPFRNGHPFSLPSSLQLHVP